jgi:hypothetical protein
MRNIYKNPVLYYILVPIVVGLWSVLLWVLYLPDSQRSWTIEQEQFKQAQSLIVEILTLDPDRIEFAGANNVSPEFGYATAVDRVANLCRIPSSNYKLSSANIMASGGKKSQSAKVVLTSIDIVRFARFLSTIQSFWAELQCDKVKLTHKESSPDQWDVELDLKYYY